jgi:hypothetical protein
VSRRGSRDGDLQVKPFSCHRIDHIFDLPNRVTIGSIPRSRERLMSSACWNAAPACPSTPIPSRAWSTSRALMARN